MRASITNETTDVRLKSRGSVYQKQQTKKLEGQLEHRHRRACEVRGARPRSVEMEEMMMSAGCSRAKPPKVIREVTKKINNHY